MEEAKTISIDEHNVGRLWSCKYRVTTVIPYCEEPKMNLYIFHQQDLNNFLEGYNDFGEFIVSVIPLRPDEEKQPFTLCPDCLKKVPSGEGEDFLETLGNVTR